MTVTLSENIPGDTRPPVAWAALIVALYVFGAVFIGNLEPVRSCLDATSPTASAVGVGTAPASLTAHGVEAGACPP